MTDLDMLKRQFESCMIGGAIGDAWGSAYENVNTPNSKTTFFLGQITAPVREWAFTDDTQLTMATCEAINTSPVFDPGLLAQAFVRYYKERRLTGLGASTLKAIIELEAGAHWSQVGRSGEFAAGNGAAMRIAPLAFLDNITREDIRDACKITHRNDEAYVGALALFLSIRAVLSGSWNGDNNLFDLIIPELPDTRVRDRLIDINSIQSKSDIKTIAELGKDGYVVNSVPFAIFAATQVNKIGLHKMYESIINEGGDTDTNASLAGQIAGTLLGINNFPEQLLLKLQTVDQYKWMVGIIRKTQSFIGY